MDGRRSPNGRYEVRLTRVRDERDVVLEREATGYRIYSYQSDLPTPIHSLSDNDYMRYIPAVEHCRAVWHSSSRFVAISDVPARHSEEIRVYDVSQTPVKPLELADYIQNALGRVDATSVDFACVSSLKRWDGDELIVGLYFTANGRHAYTCDVTFGLEGISDSYASLIVNKVSQPGEIER